LEIGPPDQPMVLQRAMELMSERLGIDATGPAHMEQRPMDVFTSIRDDAVSDEAVKPAVPVG
jgi:hypothetical protein